MDVRLHIELNLYTVLAMAMLLLGYRRSGKEYTTANRSFLGMTLSDILVLLADIGSVYARFMGRGFYHAFFNIMIHIMFFAMLFFYSLYLSCILPMRERGKMIFLRFCGMACVISSTFWVFHELRRALPGLFPGELPRGWGFVRVFGMNGGYLVLVLSSLCILAYRKELRKARLFALLSFGALPFLSSLLRIRFLGYSLLYYGISLSILLVYVVIQIEEGNVLWKKQGRLQEERTRMVLGQADPNFLYQCLDRIECLLPEKQEEAQEAINTFSGFLRANLDSLKERKRIPFSDELLQLKRYIALMKLVRGFEIQLAEDFEEEDFELPPLTLKTLASCMLEACVNGMGSVSGGEDVDGIGDGIRNKNENSIDGDIGKDNGSGWIYLSTVYEEGGIVLEMTDGGSLPAKEKWLREDEAAMLRLCNLRLRIESALGGRLEMPGLDESDKADGKSAEPEMIFRIFVPVL